MHIKKIILILFLILALTFDVFACRYTVREIGFADITSRHYHLYCYVRNDTPADFISAFKRISYAALSDANIEVETIHADDQASHSAMAYFRFWKLDTLPAAILVAPERQSIVLPFVTANQSLKEAIWSTLEDIVSSPIREKISVDIVKAYSVVLLIEGRDASKNKSAQTAVSQAIKRIGKIMDLMPKPVDEAPQLIVIPPSVASTEKILLWSLGLLDGQTDEPVVAILYGRGRRLGPLIKGEQITENSIFNLLSIVGADCECGLDRSWMIGSMIPLRWGSKLQDEVVKRLGFDAENPMVKAEMKQILSMGDYAGMQDQASADIFEGYSEDVLELKSDADVPRVSLSQIQGMNSKEPPSQLWSALFIVGGIFLAILAIGAFIFLKGYLRSRKG